MHNERCTVFARLHVILMPLPDLCSQFVPRSLTEHTSMYMGHLLMYLENKKDTFDVKIVFTATLALTKSITN